MASLWFWIVAVMIAAYVVLDGFDLGAGAIYLDRRQDERRTPPRAARDWPGVGRQRSLVARGRRHALLCFSATLCVELQRILSSADDRSVAAHSARRLGSSFGRIS